MIVYQKTAEPVRRHTLIVTPGKMNPETSDFMRGGKPRIFTVIFEWGRVEVPDYLGRWLVDHGYARETKQLIIIPQGVTA